jgi:phosphatidylinositol-3-phosphatase
MPGPCAAASSGAYKNGHNPAVWFDDLRPAPTGDGSCATSDVPFTLAGFDPSMLAAFTWITPNLCNDMHWQPGCPGARDGSLAAGDV